MPCAQVARGIRNSAPHTQVLLFDDAIDNNPCGKPIVTNANGVPVADGLCLFHLAFKYGLAKLTPPYTFAA